MKKKSRSLGFLSILIHVLALTLALAWLAACSRALPSRPTATPIPPVSSLTSAVATSQPEETVIPTAPPSLTETAAAPTPERLELDPTTATSMTLVAQVAESGASDLSWMANGEALALAKPLEVVVVDTSPAAPVTGTVAMTPTLLTTSPDNTAVAWANQDNRVELWAVPTQTVELTQTSPVTAGVTGLTFSPSGDELAAATSDNQLSVWNQASGQLEQSLQLPYWLSGLSYSPDGKFLAGVDLSNFTVHILDAATGQEIRALSWTDTASPALYGAVFSPDWKTVAWYARGTVQLMDVTTGSIGPTLSHEDFINDLSWSPDGSLIATASAATVSGNFTPAVYVWDAASGQQVNLIPQPYASIRLDFSPEGKSLAILDSSGTVQLYAAAANP